MEAGREAEGAVSSVPDPVEEAAETEARLLEIEIAKAEQAAVAQERAQERFQAAQAKVGLERRDLK